ncbi:MAG: nucleotidyltransferase domain-containing protein, partial [Flavipsychrobacter sp.]
MRVLQNEEVVSTIRATLQYFHIFKHPLYLEEIHRFSPMDIPLNELYHALREMVITGAIYEYDNFYMLEDSRELVTRRLEGKQRADALMDEAYRSVSRIARFPFVESVCISGSLSKGYANEKSDIDLFIITKKNRLWICRTILHLFKKMTFLWNAQHSFCMNYFIDESKLCIEEQNRFTATELATLIPAYNSFVYRRLIDENRAWLVNMFPNITWSTGTLITRKEPKTFRRIWEHGINL